MKTIAIDIRVLGQKRTGDETVFAELTRALLRQVRDSEAEQYLLLTNERSEARLLALRQRLELDSCPQAALVTLPARNRFLWNLWTLPLFLWRRKVDVFHTQYILPAWLPRQTRVVNHIHDVSFAAHPELIGRKDRFFLRTLIPRSLRRSDAVVVPSQFTRSEVGRYFGIPEAKVRVVPNAVGSTFQRHASELRLPELLRSQYRLPEKFLIAVGTLQPRKNIPFLIEAFAALRKRLPEYKLVLVGNRQGHHFDFRIDQLIHAHELEDAVIFPGYVPDEDLPGVMRLATAYVFPSLYEGFGIPLLEAMYLGVPAAAADIPVLREVGGSAASYFDPRSIASLEEALYNLCINPSLRSELSLQGRTRAQAYAWDKSALILLGIYHELSSR